MKLSPEVLSELQHAEVKDRSVRLVRQLNRSLYVSCNKALECLGGKWNRHAKAHVFDAEPWEPIADAIATGEVIDPKQEFQFFETPEGLAAQMVQLAHMTRDHTVLEPSAGKGRIVKAIQREFPGKMVHCCELMYKNMEVLEAMPDVNCLTADFLALPDHLGYDRIIANPPFRRNQDIIHVTKMIGHLKHGGRLVAVTSPGWTFRTDRMATTFRDNMTIIGAEWEDIPDGTFKQSGTMVRSVLLEVNKP